MLPHEETAPVCLRGARAVLVVAIMEPQFSRGALLKINFIFVELRWMNIYRGEVIQGSLNLR